MPVEPYGDTLWEFHPPAPLECMKSLFDEPVPFEGLPLEAFSVFTIEHREPRRRAIVEAFHPPLESLGHELSRALARVSDRRFHVHLPRLDWPRGYEPFCTWLALTHAAQGYQQGPQLNLGVHPRHVSIRLGWDTGTASFARFEFFCRRRFWAEWIDPVLHRPGFRVRVYRPAPWPEGSALDFESLDLQRSFNAVARGGVWWEIGERLELPAAEPLIGSRALVRRAEAAFLALVPLYDRLSGDRPD